MSNIWNYPTVIAAEALSHLEDALVITRATARDKTSEFTTTANGWKKGDSVPFKMHGDYYTDDFDTAIEVQDIRSTTRTMVIEKHFDISVAVTAREEALNLNSFSEEVIQPAAYRIAESMDTYVGTKLLESTEGNVGGANGLYVSADLFADAEDVAFARKAANYQQLGLNRYCIVDSSLEAKLLGQPWFNQSQTRGEPGVSTLQSGVMGTVMGMRFGASLQFPTSSLVTGTMICYTNNNSGANNKIGDTNLIVDGQTASKALVAGDRIQIAGVRRPLVVKTAIADTSATTTVELVDPITEIIPDNAGVSVIGNGDTVTYQGAIFDGQSLALASPMLDLPQDRVAAIASNNGINLRIVKGYDLSSKKTTLSIDVLAGAFALDPRRITLLGEGV